ncbi:MULTISPECIES: DUF1963 domain-containing protein [Saccharopolyspora]|uniref:DUF1963 domain-containing protein n=1 Tax=Saccharopolyspora gregorii TaxID=33914 RepID=A0ABP6RWS6_9PSEU|nr:MULTISPECIES: DUF1963 domain-containing protein [Saccharopolyspora]MCA1192698.1 DUF1963 domain-containing protein [Saccharopolyspora sp. 6V]MCA1227933.1 DUF1963 domain-containing protein [Saccharopolyspora sp. 6M]
MPDLAAQPRQSLRFVESEEPITEPVTKFGGQPVWLSTPAWPMSEALGRPMRFLGQIRLPGEQVRLAYLFLTEDYPEEADEVVDTFAPDSGENAFFAQPGEPADFYQVATIAKGPTFGPDHRVELAPFDGEVDVDDFATRLGGAPQWLQGDESPGEPFRFVGQFDSSVDFPFEVDFGDAGVGYAFLDEASGQGRFLWQCS